MSGTAPSGSGAGSRIPRLTWGEARRIALRAQGIGRPRALEVPDARRSRAALRRTIERTRLLQIDSVSVFARAHLMPVFTRTGSWDPQVLERASAPGPHRLLQESLAHEAALVPPRIHDLLAFRRARTAERDWGAVRRAGGADPRALERVMELLELRGPLSATEVSRRLGDDLRPEQGWGWRRTETQWIVEYLFRSGRLECVGRSPQFERRYVPAAGAGSGTAGPSAEDSLEERDAVIALVREAADALGIASRSDLADYFRLPRALTDLAVDVLRRSGELEEVRVGLPDGDLPLLCWHRAPSAAPVRAACLVSPFDPVAFHRPRLARLFDVEYRIGIYTPRERRTHGYYALPFLLGDRFAARVDLRADRARGVLEVREAHREPLPRMRGTVRASAPEALAEQLAGELQRAARWQGLDRLEVHDRGDLAPALGRLLPRAGAASA